MDKHSKVLWRACLALYGIALALILTATVVLNSHHVGASLLLCLCGVGFFVAGTIVSWFHGKAAKANLAGIRQAFDQLDYVPTQETNYEWLNREKLYLWTTELSELGFTSLGDYTLSAGGVAADELQLSESFTRLMANERRHCFAEIGHARRPATGVKEIACSVLTIFTSGDDCRTSNGAPPPATAKQFAKQFMPNMLHSEGASPSDLMRTHLDQRDTLVSERGLVVQEATSYEVYHEHVMKQKTDMRERARRIVSDITGKDCDIL